MVAKWRKACVVLCLCRLIGGKMSLEWPAWDISHRRRRVRDPGFGFEREGGEEVVGRMDDTHVVCGYVNVLCEAYRTFAVMGCFRSEILPAWDCS